MPQELTRPKPLYRRGRLWLALVLFVVLAGIALFLHDQWIRPYGGDVLVVIFLYFALRGLTGLDRWKTAAAVMMLALAVEAGQAINLIEYLGLNGNEVAQTVLGTTADLKDVMMYAVGTLIAALFDRK